MKRDRNAERGSKTRHLSSSTSSTKLKKKKKKRIVKKRRKVKKKRLNNKLIYTNEQAVVMAISMIRSIAQVFDMGISGVVERGGCKAAFAPVTPMKSDDTQKHLARTGRLLVKYSKRSKLPILVDY